MTLIIVNCKSQITDTKKRYGFLCMGVFVLYVNFRPHSSQLTNNVLVELDWIVVLPRIVYIWVTQKVIGRQTILY